MRGRVFCISQRTMPRSQAYGDEQKFTVNLQCAGVDRRGQRMVRGSCGRWVATTGQMTKDKGRGIAKIRTTRHASCHQTTYMPPPKHVLALVGNSVCSVLVVSMALRAAPIGRCVNGGKTRDPWAVEICLLVVGRNAAQGIDYWGYSTGEM